jgi:glycine betaine/proline transport system permease protein
MMSLSMVVVAAVIGAGGLGDGVMKALQRLRTGQGFLVGFAIVLCAMVLDRMVRGAETERRRSMTLRESQIQGGNEGANA